MNTFKIILGIAGTLLVVSACKDKNRLDPLENDGIPPEALTNVQVENLNGAAKISYTLPGDEDLLYVLAETEALRGKIQAKSSLYSNNVLIEGFGDTKAREVTLYAVDRGENRSEPVTVTINPLPPPMQMVRNTVDIKEDFGGVNIQFENGLEKELVISVLPPDSLGDWMEAETWYTSPE